MNKPLSKLQQHRATRLVPKSKLLRIAREEEALDRDIQAAYAVMLSRVTAHNVAHGCYAEARAAPAIH